MKCKRYVVTYIDNCQVGSILETNWYIRAWWTWYRKRGIFQELRIFDRKILETIKISYNINFVKNFINELVNENSLK